MTTRQGNDRPDLLAQTDPGLRKHERYDIDWQATVRCVDWATAERIAAANVSRGGMFLRTQRQFQPGARVEVALQLPDKDVIRLLATVRHIIGEVEGSKVGLSAGIGVEVDKDGTNKLRAVVEIARLRQGKTPQATAKSATVPAAPPATRAASRRRVQFEAGKLAGIVGIDLGTSYSGLAVGSDDVVRMVPDDLGRTRYPSLVYHGRQPSDVSIGWDAISQQMEAPARAIGGVKRLLGRRFSDPAVSQYLNNAAYRCGPGKNDDIGILIDTQWMAPTQIAAQIFKHVKQTAEAQLGRPVHQVVLTHPLSFSFAQTEALRQAADLAELIVMEMVAEPLAAALSYGFGNSAQPETIAVCDFGGSRFDCSVVELAAGGFNVAANHSDQTLGGDDLDSTLASAVAHAMLEQGGVHLQPQSAEWHKLRLRCERAKRRMATDEQTVITAPPLQSAPPDFDFKQKLERTAFERLCGPLIERALKVCGQALANGGLETDHIQHLVVCGGTTHLPFVRNALEHFFGRQATEGGVDPKEAVTLGAGLYAAQMAGHSASTARSRSGL